MPAGWQLLSSDKLPMRRLLQEVQHGNSCCWRYHMRNQCAGRKGANAGFGRRWRCARTISSLPQLAARAAILTAVCQEAAVCRRCCRGR